MNVKILKVAAILIVTLAVLAWLRGNGQYDFDIRSIIPFMRGEKISLYDGAALVLIILGLCGIGRLRTASEPANDSEDTEIEDTEDYEVLDEPDDDHDSGNDEP